MTPLNFAKTLSRLRFYDSFMTRFFSCGAPPPARNILPASIVLIKSPPAIHCTQFF
jgi:hypothetical protein